MQTNNTLESTSYLSIIESLLNSYTNMNLAYNDSTLKVQERKNKNKFKKKILNNTLPSTWKIKYNYENMNKLSICKVADLTKKYI